MQIFVKKIIYTVGTILVLLFNFIPTYAEVGPQGPVGPTELIGPTGPTGSDTSKVGPQEPVGRQVESTVAVNSETGANSTNQNSVNNSSTSNVQNNSNQQIDNAANLDLNTGHNDIKSNTGVGNITTGNADGSVSIINVANSQFSPQSSIGATTIDGSTGGDVIIPESTGGTRVSIPSHLANDLTGPNSLNTTTIDNRNSLTFVDNSNNSTSNDINILADTGDNLIAKNTQVGEIVTGDINLNVNLVNLQNFINPDVILNLDLWSINNGLNGDLIIPGLANGVTGANSINTNNVNQNNQTNVISNSSNNVNNAFDYNTNTGQNTLDSNSFVGNVTSGNSQIGGSVSNIVDAPVYYIINVFGKWLGNAVGLDGSNYVVNEVSGSNSATGPNSLNSNSVNNENETNIVSNSNNNISNKIKINANTGRNNIAENSLVGSVKTGSINIISNVQNVIGSLAGRFGKVRIGIINIFGDWNGNLSNKPLKQNPIPLSANNILSPVADPIQPIVPSVVNKKSTNITEQQNIAKTDTNILPELASTIISNENGLPSVLGSVQPDPQKQTKNSFPLMSLVIPGAVLSIWLLLELLLRKLAK